MTQVECAIATRTLNDGLAEQRALVRQKIYTRGATILLREANGNADETDTSKRCVTDPREIMSENVGEYRFEFPAGMQWGRYRIDLERFLLSK